MSKNVYEGMGPSEGQKKVLRSFGLDPNDYKDKSRSLITEEIARLIREKVGTMGHRNAGVDN